LHVDALRLLKHKSAHAIKVAFDALSTADQGRVLSNPKVITLQREIEAIRPIAATLWDQGWMQGHRPGDALTLDDLIEE
jgi:hypothetical protein